MMRVNEIVRCSQFPCEEIRHECYAVPEIEIDPNDVTLIMLSEASPADLRDYYYAAGDPLFAQTTIQAFRDAGIDVSSIADIVQMGVYLTTAVKCGKTSYGIKTNVVEECSLLLEKELALFPNTRAIMLMGDVAIKSLNFIARRAGVGRVIPAISTYKIRKQEFFFHGKRVFPSYLQAGPSFFIEKVKRRSIAEDIAAAIEYVRKNKP